MKMSRNIVFCNFSEEEKEWITICDIRDEKECWQQNNNENHRFPYIKHVTNLYELFRSSGFMAVIKAKDLDYDIESFDKKYHSKLKKFNYIAIVDEKYKEYDKFDKYSKIGLINYDLFTLDYSTFDIQDIYVKCVEYNNKNHINVKNNYEIKIIDSLKKYKMNTRELAQLINVSTRTIQRFLLQLSNKYDIRYDKISKYWYILF